MTKQGFPVDVLDKLMVCEVNEPSGVVLALEDPAVQFKNCHSPTHSVPQGSHTLSGICAARAVVSMVAENGLGIELVSGCGIVSA